MTSDEIRESIFDLLSADTTLSSLITGIYYQVAPDTAVEPFMVFSRPSGVIEQKFNTGSFDNQIWLIKVLAKDGSESAPDICNQVLDRVSAVLKDGVTTTSGTVIYSRANQLMPDFIEPRGDEVIHHQGIYFDIRVENG